MRRDERDRFDALLEEVIASLPMLEALIEEVPVVVLDRPEGDLLASLREEGLIEPDESGEDLCGLHTGVMLTERSVEDPAMLPDQVHLFREGIVGIAGGWDAGEEAVREEIRITLLHEIGHHFGLDEDGLEELGYG